MVIGNGPTGAASLQQAFARHQAGDLAAAVDLYRRVIAAQPNHAEARHLFGIALMQGGDLAAARQELERAVALDGGQAAWWNNLGLARFYGDDFAGARAGYAKALALAPGNPDFLNNLGMALQKLDDIGGAIQAFEDALSKQQGDPEIFHNYGVALQAAQRPDDARKSFETAIAISNGYPDSYASLGAVYFELDRREEAYEACRKAVALDPFHESAHSCFKTLKWTADRQDQMHDTYRWVCREMPDHPMAYLQYGASLVLDHWYAEALPVLERAIQLAPGAAQAHSLLGAALVGLGRIDEGLAAHERAMERDARDPEVLERYGQALIFAGRHGEAVAPLRDAHGGNPRRSTTLGLLTIAMTEAADPAVESLVDYDTAVTARLIDTPEGYADLDAFNAALHAELEVRHKALPPPINQTMRGGTQIPDHLFNGATGTVALLKTQISDAIKAYIAGLPRDDSHPFLRYVNPDFRFTGAWSTILRGAGYDASHIHDEGWLSGVYYVKVPDLPEDLWDAGEGCIQFGAPPDIYVSDRNRSRKLIRPEAGKLVLFPSYVWHGVKPFTRDDTRHSIAFDLI